MSRNCVTHHPACDCREAKLKKIRNIIEYAWKRSGHDLTCDIVGAVILFDDLYGPAKGANDEKAPCDCA